MTKVPEEMHPDNREEGTIRQRQVGNYRSLRSIYELYGTG
jgi:hypothetical protein